ncbi:hypothetical protein WICPIJ_009952 [Wickerhamomyces pijperi]|uniref:Uncharacterized protein n=1 Tax=Wickerhamomyces pijperi TaxID=599730 RepID=A0A9P8TC15_WICPI|nr:hypothetical protein WICPIJ_009952 [Wickerhamomyces pijperi]
MSAYYFKYNPSQDKLMIFSWRYLTTSTTLTSPPLKTRSFPNHFHCLSTLILDSSLTIDPFFPTKPFKASSLIDLLNCNLTM